MVKKQDNSPEFAINGDVHKIWSDTYGSASKTWDESHSKLMKPWIELMGEMSEKTKETSINATPGNYKEFYNEWMKTYENSFGKFYPASIPGPKETLENFIKISGESNKLYRSWIEESEENAKKTSELLKNGADPARFKECYEMWMKSYDKMSNDFIEQPAVRYQKEVYGNYTGIPDFYSETLLKMSSMWRDSFNKLYNPWIENMQKLSMNIEKISAGNAGPENYKEFFDLWVNTYQDNFKKMFDPQSAMSSREALDNFIESSEISLNLYKSWILALENMHEKFKDHSKITTDPGAYKDFFNLWVKMHEKALEDVFDKMPMVSPVKEMMEPIRDACKIYARTSIKISKMWIDSYMRASRPGV
ncbi:MAG: hypothetical protein OIN83_12535 [Candidatus Methanoperedens sp.]|nr:hypothetical protein [Candidatus Methanoperedens sp.]